MKPFATMKRFNAKQKKHFFLNASNSRYQKEFGMEKLTWLRKSRNRGSEAIRGDFWLAGPQS
jgi:hypothetical protein